jgi:plasmid stabilization system protein ParE
MKSLHFTQDALLDIEDIIIWYEEQREGLSFDFELCLEAGVSEIVRLPNAFQKKYKNVKVLFIQRFPYGIHYIVNPEQIIIIGVFHTSRSPRKWSSRS